MRSRLPVLRARRRYLAFEVESEDELSGRDVMDEIHSAQASLFGDAGVAKNRLKLITFNGRLGLIRFDNDHIRDTRAILASIYSVNGIRAAFYTKGISGTIKSATEKYLPQLDKISPDSDGRRIELEEVSGCIVHIHGREIDLCPDDRNRTKGSDTRYLGLTSFDLSGGRDDADGTADGL